MAIEIPLLDEVISIVSNILQGIGVITGLVNNTAKETSPLALETIAANASNTVNDPFHGNAPIKADIDAIRTGSNLTLQSVINALPGSSPVTLPVTPPSGYGGTTPTAVWDSTVVTYPWPTIGPFTDAGGVLSDAGTTAAALVQACAYIWPDAPDFALAGDNPQDTAVVATAILNNSWTVPSGIDWTTWNGTDTIVEFLNTVASGITWSYVNFYGNTTPGWAWGTVHAGVSYNAWFCRVSDADLPRRAGRDTASDPVAQKYTVLQLAVGLAALFATGAGDVSSIVSMITTLLADYTDLPTALGALMTWLSGRSQDTNQEQTTALTTVTTDLSTITTSGTNTLQTILDAIAALVVPDNADIATIKADVIAMQADVTYIRDHLPTAAVGAPTWPGLSGATLGGSVALSDELVVDGPLAGVLVHITSAPAGASHWLVGGEAMFYAWGEVAFQSDNGYIEPFQWLGASDAIYLPRQLQAAAHVLFHVRRDASGTVTPFTIP